ncbi:hypothetical protein EV383_4134 [Pseudonocardia sediminis]|uniref:Uncharacterized protein n=1 Tax=Pseudonocardia sediminis TaxID=1397368 RepID=A0A4Q7V195_PSEST|nr:hypothetical protein [Pseudonocardia sediminis]RZT87224.1 hypothetical protein EV383_4134 [Pseudonocardia sediminis]
MTTPTRHQLEHLARLARAVRDCPEILALYPGPTGRIASTTATGRVVGLLVQGRCLIVGVVPRPGIPPEQVVTAVRNAVRPLVPAPMAVSVVVSSPQSTGR